MILQETYTLANGIAIPKLGLGTWFIDNNKAAQAIAHGEALKNPAITAMAEKYGVSVPQLCIRYVLQLGAVALPKTANPGHMRSNAAVDFAISPEDMETLRSMEHLTDYGDYNGFPVFSGKPLA